MPLVLVTTAEEPWTNAHLDPLLEAINQCDHVVGRRPTVSRGELGRPARRAGAARDLRGPLRDVHSPCRLHRLDKLAAIPLQSASSFLDTEILAKATFLGHLIDEVAIPPLRGRVGLPGWWTDWNKSSAIRGSSDRQVQRKNRNARAKVTTAQAARISTDEPTSTRPAPSSNTRRRAPTSCVSGRA